MSASPASLVAHVGCAREMPIMTFTGNLDSHTAPIFDIKTAPLRNRSKARVQCKPSSLGLLEVSRVKLLPEIIAFKGEMV